MNTAVVGRDDYDYNIWGSDVWEISLCAYRQYRENGFLQTDYESCDVIKFNVNDHPEEFSYLLNAEYPDESFPDGIEDYDDWVGFDYLTEGNTPASILEWLGNLPEYTREEK